MAQRRKFSVEYKRETLAMLDAPGVSVGQIPVDLGIGTAILGVDHTKVSRRNPQWRGDSPAVG